MILDAEPQLFVTDMTAALAHYVNGLGFSLAFAHGEPAFYAQVTRGGAKLNLRHVDRPIFDPGRREQEGDLLSATVTVEDADRLAAEFEGRGVELHQALRTEPWGAQTFIVADPDGNLILFAG